MAPGIRGPPDWTANPALAAQKAATLDGLQVALPSIDGDGSGPIRRLAPQLLRREANRIEPLRLFAEPGGIGVRQHMRTVHLRHPTDAAANVARQPGVARGVEIAGKHALTNLEALWRLGGAFGWPTPGQDAFYPRRGEHAGDRLSRLQGLPRGDFLGRDQPALGHQPLEPGKPNLIVRLG